MAETAPAMDSGRDETGGPPARPGRNMAQAVGTAVALLILIVVCYVGGPGWFFWLAVSVVELAMFELLTAVAGSGRKPVISFALACGLTLMLAAYFAPERPELLAVVVGTAVFGSLALALRPGRGPTPASDVAWTVVGILWIGGGGAAAASMLALSEGVNLLVVHVLVTALDDIAAYFAGTRFGHHKLAPSISPSKSWEGLAGGFAAALAGGAGFGALIPDLGVWNGLAIGAIVGLLAPAGDLAESMAKRELGIKDSGRMLPGHGGMLDRLDAIIFGLPAVLLYLRVVVF